MGCLIDLLTFAFAKCIIIIKLLYEVDFIERQIPTIP